MTHHLVLRIVNQKQLFCNICHHFPKKIVNDRIYKKDFVSIKQCLICNLNPKIYRKNDLRLLQNIIITNAELLINITYFGLEHSYYYPQLQILLPYV